MSEAADIVVATIHVEDRPPAQWLDSLSLCLAGSDPLRIGEFRAFWKDWFSGAIPGEKLTVAAWEGGPPGQRQPVSPADGVVRFWQSPYCDGKWFVEGLEVIKGQRRRGIATRMLLLGIARLREVGIASLYAHIRDDNVASIRTVAKLGFVPVSRGRYVSSYGEKITGGSEYVLDLTGLPLQTQLCGLSPDVPLA